MRLPARLRSALNTRTLQLLLELAAISLLAILFICMSVPVPDNYEPDGLDIGLLETALFDPNYRQTGLEHERLAGVLLPVKIGLERYGHIPTWNPYISISEPIINNAFSYLFNPFYSLPVLLSDSFAQGTKVATFIALLLAGYNMWALAYVIGVGAVGRVAAGALYLMNGGIAGKFYAGHFQLALSLAWPPLVLAALWWTLRSKNRLAPAAFGIAFALLFFAGNIYYVLHTLICAALIVIAQIIERNGDAKKWRLRVNRLRRVGVALVFAFGLSAIQFFPIWLTRDYVDHPAQQLNGDGSIQGQYEMIQAAANFLNPWTETSFVNWVNYDVNVAVDYTYIGGTVFALIGGAAAVVILRRKTASRISSAWKICLIAVTLALTMMLWGAGQTPLLAYLYQRIPLLSEFRFLGRAHAIAALWWIVLAGIAIDILWNSARDILRTPAAFDGYDRVRLIRAALAGTLLWAYFLIYSASNTSTRLGMVLNNIHALNLLNERRFTTFTGAALWLWILILGAVALDTVLMIVRRLVFRWHSGGANDSFDWRGYGARLLRIGLVVVVFHALNDIMMVNSPLYIVKKPLVSFAAVYPTVRAADQSPYPAITLPHSPGTFEVYEAELRNWGVNEGWLPNSTNGLLSWEAGTLLDLPRWAVVSNAYGGASQDYAQQVVDNNAFESVECFRLEVFPGDPCDYNSGMTAVLYEREDVLPYTFVVPADALLNLPSKLRATNVYPAVVTSHQQDRITIQAATPPVQGDYFLVMQEENFPGWLAAADGVPLETFTAQTYRDPLTGDRGFVAVPILEGAHTYTFWFEPPGLVLGLGISLVTVAAMGWYVLRKLKRPITTV